MFGAKPPDSRPPVEGEFCISFARRRLLIMRVQESGVRGQGKYKGLRTKYKPLGNSQKISYP